MRCIAVDKVYVHSSVAEMVIVLARTHVIGGCVSGLRGQVVESLKYIQPQAQQPMKYTYICVHIFHNFTNVDT